MTNIDYDLVIIGGSIAGYQAALTATRLHAKVALIVSEDFSHQYDLNYQYTLSEISQITQKYSNLANLGIHQINIKLNTADLNWKKSILFLI
jgi:pyruvate/2-oxoglutarate dehydrogenase complex dihydrolipoamide dehydrogenase (E3) component